MLEVSFHEFDNENPLLTVMFIHITFVDCDQGQSMTRKVCHNSFFFFPINASIRPIKKVFFDTWIAVAKWSLTFINYFNIQFYSVLFWRVIGAVHDITASILKEKKVQEKLSCRRHLFFKWTINSRKPSECYDEAVGDSVFFVFCFFFPDFTIRLEENV